MSHTPGPWSFDGDYVESLALLKPLSVATLADCGHSTEGNGILIAAAPELLAALHQVLDVLILLCIDWQSITGLEDAVELATEAINKAEGRGE